MSCSNRTAPAPRSTHDQARRGHTNSLIADSILSFPEIGVELPLAELYEGIVFETEQDADRTADGAPA